MSYTFPSDEWVKQAMQKVNNSESYREAAQTWEGDIEFVITAVPDDREEVTLYMDLWHGVCRDAYEVTEPVTKPEFKIVAPFPVWKKILKGKLDPIRGIVSRKLKMRGNMMKVMQAPQAAVELVNACSKVETSYPSN